jgi:restriction endonuclease S subunit
MAVVSTNLAWCLADELIAIVRPRGAEERKRIFEYLVSEDGQRRLESAKGGTIVSQLSIENLAKIEIP